MYALQKQIISLIKERVPLLIAYLKGVCFLLKHN